MSETHAQGQPFEDFLQHLDDEHGWAELEADDPNGDDALITLVCSAPDDEDEAEDEERDAERFRWEHSAERD